MLRAAACDQVERNELQIVFCHFGNCVLLEKEPRERNVTSYFSLSFFFPILFLLTDAVFPNRDSSVASAAPAIHLSIVVVVVVLLLLLVLAQ